MLNFNQRLSGQCVRLGNEGTPVIVIDNVFNSLSPIINDALEGEFQKAEQNYPGQQALIKSTVYLNLITKLFKRVIRLNFKPSFEFNCTLSQANYSFISTSPEQLKPNQTVPHFDGPLSNCFAVLHYLNPGSFGGTAFYRHKPTGYENITKQRLQNYIEAAQAFSVSNQYSTKGYFTKSDEHFELLQVIDYLPNRLLIYPITTLHSGYIAKPNANISDKPKTGRLTANFFIEIDP